MKERRNPGKITPETSKKLKIVFGIISLFGLVFTLGWVISGKFIYFNIIIALHLD